MLSRITNYGRGLLLLPLVWTVTGCEASGGIAPVPVEPPPDAGADVNELGPCGMDCSELDVPTCAVAVCNDKGQYIGQLNTCVVIPAPAGTACEDGRFCTVADSCDGSGTCVGGTPNYCGIKPVGCESVVCYEELKKCDTLPAAEGASCTPSNLCHINGICKVGKCVGEPKDCSFSPLTECNAVSCEPATGKCVGNPDANKDNAPCVLTGDLCKVNKVCQAGQCVGGTPKDCSALDFGCRSGTCDSTSGLCVTSPAPVGTLCTEGITECHVGACAEGGVCAASVAPDNSPCNDYDSCTEGDTCSAGTCLAGSPVTSCSVYLHEGFETCPSDWTFGGDWECGKPTQVGPETAHIGTNVIGTNLDGLYTVNQAFATAIAALPPLDLTTATNPKLSFWAWQHTEGGSFDGWNLKISTDGGQNYPVVMGVTPAYYLTISGQPAWGGDHSTKGWQYFEADLTPYVGKTALLRVSFRSDGASVYPGLYVDEVIVAEPMQTPMYIMTTSPLEDVYSGMSYSAPITKVGGSSNAVWSIKPGGQNTGWLTIDPMTGELKGIPSKADVGPVLVTVRVEEPMLPSNFAERTFAFSVLGNIYYTSFETMCPGDWTLTGDWECGVPTGLGPGAAYIGTQCLATKIDGNYNNLQTWVGTTATSPEIDLTGSLGPLMSFRMWLDTEGATYDGVNLQVSTDGGMTFSVVQAVSPTYPLVIAGRPAWGGHQFALGWQFVQADLSAYAGQKIRLRFSFQSDSSSVFPGAYIDDIFIDD
ncbi:MAG: immune inhibitor A [Polyangiaceae bacterium]|nr:immune inhibitor A [Polyangiaceae bacterium]